MRRIAILGSTGSIGRQAVDVVRDRPESFEVVALVANTNKDLLDEQARATGAHTTGLGAHAAEDIAGSIEADVVLNAIVGAAGLRASLAALTSGTNLALANKESLVAGGELCTQIASQSGAAVIPVDSEHAALFHCLTSKHQKPSSLILTASGGPFRERIDLDDVTPAEALAHPTWSMGPKITVDSATLMNKGLEVIEAHHLFGFAYGDIEVVVHPQSIVHGIVRFRDGTMLMQAAPPDMKIPIRAALSWPDPVDAAVATSIDLGSVGALAFEPLDRRRFPAVDLAYEVGRRGKTYAAAMNAANEVAVHAFLKGWIAFPDIVRTVEAVVSGHDPGDATRLIDVLEADRSARDHAEKLVGSAVGVRGRS